MKVSSMLKTKYIGHNFEMLLTNHGHQHIDVANITITAMNGKIIFKGALAGHVISHVLGDETASPDVESTAENLHNAYAAMPEHRQRRFWVIFFYLSSDNLEKGSVKNLYSINWLPALLILLSIITLDRFNDVWTKRFQYLHIVYFHCRSQII